MTFVTKRGSEDCQPPEEEQARNLVLRALGKEPVERRQDGQAQDGVTSTTAARPPFWPPGGPKAAIEDQNPDPLAS